MLGDLPDPALGRWPITLPLRLSSFSVLEFQVIYGGEIWGGVLQLQKCVFEGICEHKCTSTLTFKRLLQQALLSHWPLSESVFTQVDPLPPAPCRPAGSEGGNEAAGAVGCQGGGRTGHGESDLPLQRSIFTTSVV